MAVGAQFSCLAVWGVFRVCCESPTRAGLLAQGKGTAHAFGTGLVCVHMPCIGLCGIQRHLWAPGACAARCRCCFCVAAAAPCCITWGQHGRSIVPSTPSCFHPVCTSSLTSTCALLWFGVAAYTLCMVCVAVCQAVSVSTCTLP